jgi:hypothetical protein
MKYQKWYSFSLIVGIVLMNTIPFATGSTEGEKKLRVIFDSILINEDHDPLGSAWQLDAYVNEERVPLSLGSGLININNGEEKLLGKGITINVPNNGTVRILTAGFDEDLEHLNLPDISADLREAIPEIRGINLGAIYNITRTLIQHDKHDALGIIQKEYGVENSFGIGEHRDCSIANDAAGDLHEIQGTSCDFILNFRIVDQNRIPSLPIWHTWKPINDMQVKSVPVLFSDGPGKFHIVVLGEDNRLWYSRYDYGWEDWFPITKVSGTSDAFVPSKSPLALTSISPGRLDLLARGTNNQIWHNWYDEFTGGWHGWGSLGDRFTSGPSVFSTGPSHLSVYALENRFLKDTSYDFLFNGWNIWRPSNIPDVIFSSPPTWISFESGRKDAFGITRDNSLWHGSYSNVEGQWRYEPPEYMTDLNFTSPPAVVSRAYGTVDLFVQDSNNNLLHKALVDNIWSEWESLGNVTSPPAAASTFNSDRIDIFAVNGSTLMHNWWG